jgi:hypothetical protein
LLFGLWAESFLVDEVDRKTGNLTTLILFVADLFHPIGVLAVELFNDGDVRHGGSGSRTVPMLFTAWKPDDVSRTNFLDGSSLALG